MQSHHSGSRLPLAGFDAWQRDECGNILMLFAIMAPIILGIAGIALDYGRAHSMQTRLKSAADSVAIAAVSAVRNGSTIADAKALADNLWAGNSANSRAANVVPSIAIINTDGIINVSVSYTATVDGLLGRLVGLGSIAMSGSSAAEVSLAAPPNTDEISRGSGAGNGRARGARGGCAVDGLQELARQSGVPIEVLCAELGLDALEVSQSGELTVADAPASVSGCGPQPVALPQSQLDDLGGLYDLLRQIWPSGTSDPATIANSSGSGTGQPGCVAAAGAAQVRLVK